MGSRHAIVLVSGGAAVTPFTTPTAAAASGLAAGNTMTALRERLLDAGHEVYTAPARVGAGEVREDPGWEGFGDVPEVLPAELTVNAVGTLDGAGIALDAFLEHLVATRGIESFDIVAHSMGGLFSRAAIRRRRDRAAVPVRRLVTIGTPWTGGLPGDFLAGDLSLEDAAGDGTTVAVFTQTVSYASEHSEGAAEQVSQRFVDSWNEEHAGVLDGVAVTVLAGSHFDAASEPELLWPHDGLVARRSALALRVPVEVLPAVERVEFADNVHSIFIADAVGLPWERALTWNPAAIDAIEAALAR